MSHDVFISHSAKDKTTADAVCAMLESNGVRCWIAPRDVTPSMEWGECIIEAIEECRIMVLVFTTNANESSQIRREVERAVNHGVAILPLRVEDVIPARALEYFIGNVHWLDAMSPPLENHLKNLAETIKMLLARMPSRDSGPPAPLVAPIPPVPAKRKERALDAAVSRTVPVGRATQVVAMIREADSQGLRHVLKIEEDYSAAPEDVRSKDIEIEFPVDAHGNQLPVEFNLRLEAPDFEPRSQSKRLIVPVSGDSEVCSFLVTAQRSGELLLNLEVLQGESNVLTRTFKTTAQSHAAEVPFAGNVLVSVRLYTSASAWSMSRSATSTPQRLPEPLPPAQQSRIESAAPPLGVSSPAASQRAPLLSKRMFIGVGSLVAVALLSVGVYFFQNRGAGDEGSVVSEATSSSSQGSTAQPPQPNADQPTQPTSSAATTSPGKQEEQSSQAVPAGDPSTASKSVADLYGEGILLEAQGKLSEAISSYQSACDGGVGDSCNNLGSMYQEGKGLSISENRAAQLFQKACDLNSAQGCYSLAADYEKGRGVPEDKPHAAGLYQKGCDLGNSLGCLAVKRILMIK